MIDCNFENENEKIIINCLKHNNKKILKSTYCSVCKELLCEDCLVEFHNTHPMKQIDDSFLIEMIDGFKNNQLNDLKGYKESDKFVKNALEFCFEESKKINIKLIEDFKKIIDQVHKHIQIFELNTIKRINTNLDNNELIYSSLLKILEQDSKFYNSMINKYSDNNDNDTSLANTSTSNTLQYTNDYNEVPNLVILNELEISKEFIKRRKNTINQPFKIAKLTDNIIDKIIKQLSEFYNEKDYTDDRDTPYKQHLMINKKFNAYICDYYITHGEPIPDNETSVAFDGNYIHDEILKLPINVDKLSFFNGFKLDLDKVAIPNQITKLIVWDIEKPLGFKSISSEIEELYVRSGYKHELLPGIIPKTCQFVFICDLKLPLIPGSIPEGTKELKIRNRYSHPITKGIISSSVQTLFIDEILTPLSTESVPKTVKSIHFQPKYSHSIPHEIIPEKVDLEFYDIKQLNLIQKIPNKINELFLHKYQDYKHLIPLDCIDSTIKINK